MYETPNKALASARELSLQGEQFRQLGPGQWHPVLTKIFETFANTRDQNVAWLWSRLQRKGASIQIENGLEAIAEMFSPNTSVWLLLEDWAGTKQTGNYWIFEGSYSAVTAVLANMHHMEYYIVDKEFRWMILENHHKFLVGIGDPAESFIRNLDSAR